jgi:1-acyl-sn-glycerol-3-phosphate acyltransferase
MYIIFYLYLAVFVNGLCKSHETINKLFSCFIRLLDPVVNIHYDRIKYLETTPDRILLISNHVKLIDYISLHAVLIKLYPNHLPVFVAVDKVKKIPYYGNIFSKYYMLITRNNSKTSLSDMIQKCKELRNKKTVIVLFPEGDIYRHKNVVKSNNYCNDNKIEPFNNVLCPKIKAYETILKYFRPQQVNLAQLTYSKNNNIDNTTFMRYTDFLNIFTKYPTCDLSLTNVIEKSLVDIWRQLDYRKIQNIV